MHKQIAAGVAIVTLAVCGGAMPVHMTPTKSQMPNTALVQRSFEAWRDGKGSPYDLLAEDARWTIVGRTLASKTYAGREAFMREVIRPFNARMSAPLRPEIQNLYADGDTVIVHFNARGTARDGRPYENTYAWFLTFRDGAIVRAVAFFDSVEFNDLWTRVAPGGRD